MKTTFALGATGVAGMIVLAGHFAMPVQGGGGGGIGPDVAVSRLGLESFGSQDDFHYYGSSGGIRAFSMASTSCNVGDEEAEWIDTSPDARNPVIAQNMYRWQDGQFEQIGMSWLKHSFCAVSEFTCGACQPTSCNTLGIGCADTYWATLNGSHGGLGPRWKINPQGMGPGGVHDDQYEQPQGNNTIRGRLQLKDADILAGGRFVAEIHYVTHDEDLERRWNNASWREVDVSLTSIDGVGSGQESVQFQQPGILAWRQFDNAVQVIPFEDVPGEGRFHLGVRVFDNEDGTWTYEYALHNMNSHRGARSFSVPLPAGAIVSDTGFHDVDYHSGDGEDYVTRDGTDWAVNVGGLSATWSTGTYDDDPNANALLWSTLYNFRVTTNAAPTTGPITVGLFRPGFPANTTVMAPIPGDVVGSPCPADIAGDDGVVDTQDLLALLAAWGTDGDGADIAEPLDLVDTNDLLGLLAEWGDCE